MQDETSNFSKTMIGWSEDIVTAIFPMVHLPQICIKLFDFGWSIIKHMYSDR